MNDVREALNEAREQAKARAQEWLDAALERATARERRRCRIKRAVGTFLLVVGLVAAAAVARYRSAYSLDDTNDPS